LTVKIFAPKFGGQKKRPTASSRTATSPAFPVTCLDARNVPTLPGIPPKEVKAAQAHVKDLLVSLIDKQRAAKESMLTYVTDDGESGDWLAEASSTSKESAKKTSSDIADEKIRLWQIRSEPMAAHKNPLIELSGTPP